jgi:hypothetical protein
MNSRSAPILAVAVLAVVILDGGCSNHKTPVPGASCQLNSDCESPLSCAFSKCHEACRANGDCPTNERCVWSESLPDGGTDTTSLRVCLLNPHCALDSTCPAPLVCGRDLECRNECEADLDCPSTAYRCVVGGPNGEKVCAEPSKIDPSTGELAPAPDAGTNNDASSPADGGAGTGGGAGNGGAGTGGASGGSSAGGATAGAAGTAGARGGAGGGGGAGAGGGGASGSGAGASAGAGGAAGASGGGASGGAAGRGGGGGAGAGGSGQIVVPEVEPNDDRTHATPYTLGTQVMAMSMTGDSDYFAITAPASDAAGGYFVLSTTNVGAGVVHVEVFSAADNNRIGFSDGAGAGGSSLFYWAAHPGQTYHARASGSGSPAFEYTFAVSYTKIADPFEPNDTRDTPAPITTGQSIHAYFFSGFVSSAPVTDQDWYSINLTAGSAMLSLTNVATNERLEVDLYNAADELMKIGVSANLGSGVIQPFTVPTTGTYRIVVVPFSFTPGTQQGAVSTVTDVIDSFTRPYTLLVTQP